MFGNPAAERAAIEMTYEDTATISRTETTTGSNNITKTVPVVKYSEIICALSYSGSDKSQQTDAQNEIDYDAVLFAAPDLLVLRPNGPDQSARPDLPGRRSPGRLCYPPGNPREGR